MQIVVAAFTAVHEDTLLTSDEQTFVCWAHGLSAVEPRRFDCYSRQPSTDRTLPNLFISRQLPVPTESILASNNVEAAFEVANIEIVSSKAAVIDVEPDGVVIQK